MTDTRKHIPPLFDSYPYLLTHLSREQDAIRLLPAGHLEATLREATCRDEEGAPPATLVLGPRRFCRLERDQYELRNQAPPAKPRLVIGPTTVEIEFTETAELYHRYRYYRVWYAWHYGRELERNGNGATVFTGFRPYSGAARAQQELGPANEVTRFLIRAGGTTPALPAQAPADFLQVLSWHDNLHTLWNAGLRHEWLLWLADVALELGVLPGDTAAGLKGALCAGPDAAAVVLQRDFIGLFAAPAAEKALAAAG